MDLIEKELTYKIRAAVFEVSRCLGVGFLEKVYERALVIELENIDLNCNSQLSVPVTYKNCIVGEYFADIIVENIIILELKARENIRPEHTAQLINYLKATGMKIGLLISSTHPKVEIKRFVL